MKPSKKPAVHCLVDDSALTRNLDEIESWASKGIIVLVVPLHTLSRLQALQNEKTPIAPTAAKAVRFLDQSTSSRGNLRHDPVILQGPDEAYMTWAEVEAHYLNVNLKKAGLNEQEKTVANTDKKPVKDAELPMKADGAAGGALSQMLLDKLNFAKDPAAVSPSSTPPLSPSSSGPQSSKTSPEVTAATMICQDQTPVPPSLKPLFNSVVWYVHEKKAAADQSIVFLTNSADTMHLARDFGIPTKNIHQLRSSLGLDEPAVKAPEIPKKEVLKKSPKPEHKTLFSYDDAESDDEEVVFKPRGGRGSARGAHSSKGSGGGGRNKGGNPRSPRTSFSSPNQATPAKPQIPVEEIDPDSFDRGSFARGSTPLVNTSNHTPVQVTHGRNGHRGNNGQGGGNRGASNSRGQGRGMERGSARGRGRLFVP